MFADPTPSFVGILTLVVVAAGAMNGVAGFGFAVVGTMALATIIDPTTAVVFMIVPIFSVNVSLVRDLSIDELRTCSRRFGPLIGAALVGTVAGMAALDSAPEAPLRVGLGLLTLGFVASAQHWIQFPAAFVIGETERGKTQTAMLGIGGVSGLLFGGTNVGVQLIAYLRSMDLSHGTFIGVVAMVFLGLNGIRAAIASLFGLYPSSTVAVASVLAVIPAVIGVAIGKRLRSTVHERGRRFVVLGLLTIIGIRLVSGGLGIA